MLTAEHIDTASPSGEILHLLPCYATGRNAHPFTLNAVVCPEQYVVRLPKLGLCGLLNQSNLQSQLLEPSERSLWLVQVINLVYQRFL